ncbi:TPA: NAD(P)-dependent oxidoreductase [Pseudomonas aeruginosa]|uniref:NAD(P)-dependent oxidoreductase n=1 Tax=Pseudomonas aeruginosa TaxID=287 RepID=UPI00071BC739|nr:NAD(P)-dependent oxidoreductase [Pseudomonas aeruginosa]AZZ13508.1 NAD(P)-dependent oxidoreductase [Pseudomonas aeruginosa]EKN9356205.1 NAD(P)-dependent oxidoreductase [Pseudomonas aeruginosa]KSJ40333.1 3-beta hydroxysteroid dehydrogenase [Pseudomonas aeruginosa]MBG5164463.1 NAD(P)-dependent oxidoreductase [Pseudomonas aeruginosa]MBS9751064.1 NAD(P)-dependent oxidoreductase [Pseudomonas aeruginosa]
MKIALIGATGHVGHYFLNEALQRGHAVTALVRDPSKLAARNGLCVVQADVSDPAQVASAVAGHEVVISAFNGGWGSADLRARHAAGSQAILDGVKRSGVPRLLVLGGAGSLEIAPGQRLVDSPEFPEQWKQGALGAADALDQLRGEQRLDWVFLSPAMLLEPGQRSGKFRLGGDQVLFDAKGESRISLEDLAVAMLDEAEQPRHHRQRFTVAY